MERLAVFYVVAQVIERLTEPLAFIQDKARKDKTEDYLQIRTYVFWGICTVLGLVFAFQLELGFFALLRHPIDPTWDYILTGVALGAGTKPIHDVIAYVEKASEKKGKA